MNLTASSRRKLAALLMTAGLIAGGVVGIAATPASVEQAENVRVSSGDQQESTERIARGGLNGPTPELVAAPDDGDETNTPGGALQGRIARGGIWQGPVVVL